MSPVCRQAAPRAGDASIPSGSTAGGTGTRRHGVAGPRPAPGSIRSEGEPTGGHGWPCAYCALPLGRQVHVGAGTGRRAHGRCWCWWCWCCFCRCCFYRRQQGPGPGPPPRGRDCRMRGRGRRGARARSRRSKTAAHPCARPATGPARPAPPRVPALALVCPRPDGGVVARPAVRAARGDSGRPRIRARARRPGGLSKRRTGLDVALHSPERRTLSYVASSSSHPSRAASSGRAATTQHLHGRRRKTAHAGACRQPLPGGSARRRLATLCAPASQPARKRTPRLAGPSPARDGPEPPVSAEPSGSAAAVRAFCPLVSPETGEPPEGGSHGLPPTASAPPPRGVGEAMSRLGRRRRPGAGRHVGETDRGCASVVPERRRASRPTAGPAASGSRGRLKRGSTPPRLWHAAPHTSTARHGKKSPGGFSKPVRTVPACKGGGGVA